MKRFYEAAKIYGCIILAILVVSGGVNSIIYIMHWLEGL